MKNKDYEHTYSPIAKLPTVRVLIALATARQWNIHQLDVSNAFLHGSLDEKVYILPDKATRFLLGRCVNINGPYMA